MIRIKDRTRRARGALIALVWGSAAVSVLAQSGLPPTAPTTASVSQLPSAHPEVPAPAAGAQGSDLQWNGQLLLVHANNTGLNELLRSIAVKTGTRLVGSVPEDRIFGQYGPAPLAQVITNLLDGLPVNVLFVDRNGNAPAELTLTARNGAATPPMPSTSQYEPEQTRAAQQAGPPGGRGFAPGQGRMRGAPGADMQSSPSGAESEPGTADAGNSGANPASPNGVKTPEEIFQQLQRLRATSTNSRH